MDIVTNMESSAAMKITLYDALASPVSKMEY